jgi:hypothetical protein
LKRSAGGWPTNPHLLPPGWSAIYWMLPSLFATLFDRGRRVPELNDNQYRELLTRNYRIVYRVTPDEVVIIALIHGARDFRSWWRRFRRNRT